MMMKGAIAAALTTSVTAMPVKFTATDCGASSGHYQSSEVVPAQPHTGQVFKVTNHFSFDEDVSGGQFDVKVTALGGIPLKHQTGPLCGFDTSYDVYLTLVKVASVTIYGSQCPIAKGPAEIKYDIKLANILPPTLGNAAFHLTAKDQKGTDIVCVQAHLGIVLENSTESTAGSNGATLAWENHSKAEQIAATQTNASNFNAQSDYPSCYRRKWSCYGKCSGGSKCIMDKNYQCYCRASYGPGSGCPGGSLKACMLECSPDVYKACVEVCAKRCHHDSDETVVV